MAKAKGKKNIKVAPEKPKQVHYPIKTAYECEQCDSKCIAGTKYLEQLKISQFGKGVRCMNGNKKM